MNGTEELNRDLIEEFEVIANNLKKDPKFNEIEVTPCDVNSSINLKIGVAGFWVRAMCNHPNISEVISEKDRLILQYLKNIKMEMHEDYGYGFDLIF